MTPPDKLRGLRCILLNIFYSLMIIVLTSRKEKSTYICVGFEVHIFFLKREILLISSTMHQSDTSF